MLKYLRHLDKRFIPIQSSSFRDHPCLSHFLIQIAFQDGDRPEQEHWNQTQLVRDHDFNVEELSGLSVSVEGGEAVQFTSAPAAVGLHFDEMRGVLTTLLFLSLHFVP